MRDYLDIDLEVLTPAFLAGANQKDVEPRSASVRGLLRWWWRALVGHRYASAERLAAEEAKLFGSTEHGLKGSTEHGLKSPVAVSVRSENWRRIERATAHPISGEKYAWRRGTSSGSSDVLPYLGYGPIRIPSRNERTVGTREYDPVLAPHGKAVFIRPAFEPGTRFSVRLAWWSDHLTEQHFGELVRAASSWVTLGGIGSRSRKGWGALDGVVRSASRDDLRKSAEESWRQQRGRVLTNGSGLPSTAPLFPQLEYRQVHRDDVAHVQWEKALGSMGLKYKKLRAEAGLRWMSGDATPRRASSVLVTLVREPDRNLRGVIALLPCSRENQMMETDELRGFMGKASAIFGRREGR
jgi:CRISPR type III-B/RAMP module RAMP protein Cmr1